MNDFTIDERFGFLNNYLKLIELKEMSSLIISGSSGIGKSHEVKRFLNENGITPFYVKGFSTARALYDALYHNKNGLIVFDDCDSILEDKVAINILKGALDSYDERIISWLAKNSDKSMPNQFNFQGQIIFISNLNMNTFDKAMKSRALTIDLTMTFDERIERLFYILPDVKTEVDFYDKYEVLVNLVEFATDEEKVTVRALEKGIIFKTIDPINWEAQFKFFLTS